MRLFLNNAFPASSFFNKVNGGRVDPGNDCKRVSWYSRPKCLSNVNDLSLSQLVSRCFFTAQINKTSSPLVSCVVSQSKPLKVFWSIVQFVSVDVIDRQTFFKSRHKSQSNQSVYKHFWPLISKFCGNNVVSAFTNPRLDFRLRSNTFKSLSIAKPRSFSFGNCLWAKYSSILRHKPVDAFFVNGYGVHAVNYIAGHR